MPASDAPLTFVVLYKRVAVGFVNSGTAGARHIDIHASRRMSTFWLEDWEMKTEQ